ncbi:MAG: MFS transporter, partial [Chloroflexi bacterium]
VGWGVAGPVSGYLVGLTSLRVAFYVSFALLLVCAGIAVQMPVRRVSLSAHVGQGLRLVATSWRWAVFLTVMFIAGAALAISFNYLFLYLAELNASSTWMGLSLTLATLSEMAVMFYAAQLLTRWGTRTLLMASLLFMALRLLGYAATGSAAVVIALQLLHGPSFGLMWVAAVARADQLAPPGMSATAQGLNSGVTMGLGAAFGSITGGFVYQSVGLASMFGWAGAAVLVALILFVVAGWVAAQQKLKATAGEA